MGDEVKDCDHRHSIEQQVHDCRHVREQDLLRGTGHVAPVNQVQVPKDPVQDEGERPLQPVLTDLRDSVRRDRVEAVGKDAHPRHGREHLVQERERVLPE